MILLHLHGHLHVLGHMGVFVRTKVSEHLRAEDGERTRSNIERAERGEHAAQEYRPTVFRLLDMLENIFRFMNFDRRGDGHDFRVIEVGNNFLQREWSDKGVRVEAANKFRLNLFESEIHSCVLAAVLLVDNTYSGVRFETIQHFERAVGRTVVHKDEREFVFRIVQSKNRLYSRGDSRFFVETGDDDRGSWEVGDTLKAALILKLNLAPDLKVGNKQKHLEEEGYEEGTV